MRNVYVDFGKDNLRDKSQPNGVWDDLHKIWRENKIYFDGVCYEGSFIKSGNKCRFLWSKDKDYGYKIFINDYPQITPPTKEEVRVVFSIQKLLSDNGFSPEPYEIIKCYDDSREYFVIKMETIKGKSAWSDHRYHKPWGNPVLKSTEGLKQWVKTLEEFCKENRIGSDRRDLDIYGDSNCMRSEKDNKIYLVDVDVRFGYGTPEELLLLQQNHLL
jgi:hypothetical protein